MDLRDNLYTIVESVSAEGGATYTIKLDPEHFIYKAHFPCEPITPGVCIMQIAHELLQLLCGCKLEIDCVKNVKFLRIIVPAQEQKVDYIFQKVTEEEKLVKCQVSVSIEGETYAKLSIVCRK
jgi:3-hydroxyacyl-[acyl-carrier-protein] dehydratase